MFWTIVKLSLMVALSSPVSISRLKVQSSIGHFFFLIAETQYFLEGNPGVLIMICRDARIEYWLTYQEIPYHVNHINQCGTNWKT